MIVDTVIYQHEVKVGTGFTGEVCPLEIVNETDMIDLVNYPPYTECFYVYTDLQNVLNESPIRVKYEFIKEATAESLFIWETEYAPKTGRPYTHVCSIAWIGTWPHEISEPGRYLCEVSFYEGTSYNGKVLVALNVVDSRVEPPPPEPGECPDFWTDPVGAVLCWMISGLEIIWGFSVSLVSDTVLWIQTFQQSITAELYKLFQDPIKYIQDLFGGFLKALEQEQATTNLDLRQSEEGRWTAGSEWLAGQYKTVDDLTDAEFKALVDKGLTDNKEALRAADFRLYKLDASSKATFEATMNTLRSTVGGLWLAIDTNTELLLEWDSEQFAYVVNYVEALNTNWTDRVWDVVEGIVSFATGGFLDWDNWYAGTVLDWEGYTDSKILDVKEWYDIHTPNLVEAMFDWAKPVIQPIIDAVGFLGELTGIFTGTKPEDPYITEAKDKIKEEQDAIEEIVERLRT